MSDKEILTGEVIYSEPIFEIEQSPFQVYAKSENGLVYKFYSTCFQEVEEGDTFIKEGYGDEFVHVGYYQVLTGNFLGAVDDISAKSGTVQMFLNAKISEMRTSPTVMFADNATLNFIGKNSITKINTITVQYVNVETSGLNMQVTGLTGIENVQRYSTFSLNGSGGSTVTNLVSSSTNIYLDAEIY